MYSLKKTLLVMLQLCVLLTLANMRPISTKVRSAYLSEEFTVHHYAVETPASLDKTLPLHYLLENKTLMDATTP